MRANLLIFNWIYLVPVFMIMAACQSKNHHPASASEYQWTKVADASPWEKSYNFQMLTIGDTLWVMHSDGNWFSTDGKSWMKSGLPNAIGNLAFLDYVVFHNRIFGLGHLEGNIETHSFRPTVYISNRFTRWDSIENTNLPRRFFYHPFVFDDMIWIVGGEDDSNIWADVIHSPDGIHWTVMKDKLPFGPVNNSQVLFFQNKLWKFGEDVWSSANGLDWTQVTPSIITGVEVFGYAPVVFDDHMWLIGCNRNGQFQSQVLYSADGLHWTNQTAPWTPRGGVAASVFKNEIWMTGGKYGGTPEDPVFYYSNDVWRMKKS